MSRSANPVTVGAFVFGMLLLAFLLVLFFTGSSWFSQRDRYTLVYETSIKGLNIGAPVTLKGVKIGEVADIRARMYGDSLAVFNNITLEIDPHMLERENGRDDSRGLMEDMIKRGLCAQLRLQSLLTGLLYVDVDFRPDKERQLQDVPTAHTQIPTTRTDLEQLTRDLESIDIGQLSENLQQIVSGINSFVNDKGLQNTINNLNEMLEATRTSADSVRIAANNISASVVPLATNGNQTVVTLNQKLPALIDKLDTTLVALQQTAASLQQASANTSHLTSEDSPLLYRLENAAASIDAAATQVKQLSDTLERQPESLLYGKQEK